MNDFKAIWAELNAPSTKRPRAADARRALLREGWRMALGALVDGLLLLWLGGFLYDHRAEPRFLAPALLLHVGLILSLVAQAAGLALARGVDYDGPVAATQRRVARLALLRARTTQWIFLTAPLLWIPLLIVFCRGPLHVDPYRFLDRTWLVGNLAFGVAFIPLALWASRRLERRFGRSRVLRALSGSNLRSASALYRDLAEFEGESPGARASR